MRNINLINFTEEFYITNEKEENDYLVKVIQDIRNGCK